jgi:hypothetical protein
MMRLFLLPIVGALLCGCAAKGQSVPEFTFRNLHMFYPKNMEVTEYQEYEEDSFVSFFLQDKDDPVNRVEFGISEFPADFLQTVPREELLGELAADADELRNKYLSIAGNEAVQQSEITISRDVADAYIMAQVEENGIMAYCLFSSRVVGNYNICTMSRSRDPETMELFISIIDNITINQ